jgi:transposase-like protein
VEEKTALVLAALRQDQSVRAIAQQAGVNENQLHRWKRLFLQGGQRALREAPHNTSEQQLREENERLKRILGEKALEIDELKKEGRS